MTDLRTTIRHILDAHLPDAKDYPNGVKRCTCGHEVPIGDMAARTEHLLDVLTEGLAVTELSGWADRGNPFLSVDQLYAAWIATRGYLDRIATWHSQETAGGGMVSGLCAECGSPWPCDTRRLIEYGEVSD